MDYPLVSCISLVRKQSIAEVSKCIDCFQNQSYPYKELLLVNNADSQLEASNLIIEAQPNVFIADTPVKLTSGAARNYGISLANGTILAQFDPKTWHNPNRLKLQVATMAQHSAHASVLSKCLKYSHHSKELKTESNNLKAIPESVICVRPKGIDYPEYDRGESLEFLTRLNQAHMKMIAIDDSSLMCLVAGESKEFTTEENMPESLKEFLAK